MSDTLTARAAPGWKIDEGARNALIAAYDLEALRDSAALTTITDFAAALCGCPVALVNIVGEQQQSFIARTGYDAAEGPVETSFCAVGMHTGDMMVVPDATRDPRFADNPQVTGAPGIRFYAGVTLATEHGVPIGSLCVIDTEPHPDGLTPLQRQGLTTLADNVTSRLRDSRDAAAWRHAEHDARRALDDSEGRFRTLADTMPQMVWSTLPDGFHDYYNARWYEFTGVPEGSTDGEGWNGMFHPDDRERAWARWRQSLTSGDPYEIEYRLRYRDGTYRWVLGRALPIRDGEGRIVRWFGTCTDIHEQKLTSEEREVISQELSHRIKNIFSVVSGLVAFSARANPEFGAIASDLRDRITALGRAHDFVRPHSPASMPKNHPTSLIGLLGELFVPYQLTDRDRVTVSGEDVAIDDRSATPLALLFHELATNATKYGALSAPDGSVSVTMARSDDSVTLDWREQGGPAVAQPTTTGGFGTQLMELSAVRQLGGTVRRDWKPEGLDVTVTVPLAAFRRR
ncbi:PAS domain-containing protein [Sphingomonas bacterium]|uniref:sensor histidine kinase n=1 Tax=Sphingomonas bacterium TaxID=1895847 RepID=UPI00260A0D90|nr:PAS domain-containing protein [Sphingomonas bacterium]MDB5679616.1 histidine kinase [Sphingomonas bacterium]